MMMRTIRRLLLLAVMMMTTTFIDRVSSTTGSVPVLGADTVITGPPSLFPIVTFALMNKTYGVEALFGVSPNDIGDINGDGVNDFGIPAPLSSPAGTGPAKAATGTVFVFWGKLAWDTNAAWPNLQALPNVSLGLILYGSADHQYFGSDLNGCDVNNDKIDDILVGTNAQDTDYSLVAVIYGRSHWESTGGVLSISSLNGANGFIITPGQSQGWSSYFGSDNPKCVGDFNGDGIVDLQFTDYSADGNRGRGVLLFGRLPWPAVVDLSLQTTSQQAIFFTGSKNDSSYIGSSSAALDLNLDGHVDLSFGAAGTVNYNGVIHIIWGGQASYPHNMTLPVQSITQGLELCDGAESAIFGWEQTVCDFNGDGHNDLVVDGNGLSHVIVLLADASVQYTAVLMAAPDLPNAVIFQHDDLTQRFGFCLSSGDFDGDEYDDVFIGANGGEQVGRVFIWFGSASPSSMEIDATTDPDGVNWSRITGNHIDGELGYSVGVHRGPPGTADDILAGAPDVNSKLGLAYLVHHTACKVMSNSGICTRCMLGYGLSSAATGTCVACNAGYFSNGTNPCQQVTPFPNCVRYSQANGRCTLCSEGYGLNSLSMSSPCSLCTADTWSDGYFSCNSVTTTPGCSAYSITTGKCIQCANGYGLSSATCSLCSGADHSNGTTPCFSCTSLCQICIPGQCTKCSAGYGIDGSGCTVCTSLSYSDGTTACKSCSNCATCTSTTGFCTRCLAGYEANNGKCTKCTSVVEGFCQECSAGHGLESGSCAECQEGEFGLGGTSSCQLCVTIPNCVACNQYNGECTQCYSGYSLDDTGACALVTNSSAIGKSNGLSGSTIGIIAAVVSVVGVVLIAGLAALLIIVIAHLKQKGTFATESVNKSEAETVVMSSIGNETIVPMSTDGSDGSLVTPAAYGMVSQASGGPVFGTQGPVHFTLFATPPSSQILSGSPAASPTNSLGSVQLQQPVSGQVQHQPEVVVPPNN